jgi:hypothetical protein
MGQRVGRLRLGVAALDEERRGGALQVESS